MMPAIYDDTLRSKESNEPAKLIAFNRTGRPVDILWINYAAKLVLYRLLGKDDQTEMDTFKTHPWIFRDCYTGLLMHVNHKEVFWPEASTDKRPIQHVYIHYPVQSLKTISSWAIITKARNLNEISQMEIPQTLRNDLGTLYRQFYNHHVTLAQRRMEQRRNLQRRQQQQQQLQLQQHRNQ
ncbi:von Hippel-Lindau tumor suppressor homolog [Contarinia nasturtii]|uniref:von Hippel-Lindau tumor suppressor homolog n=1 Tax=Contarinia nasturtii TaxID=265458 RepID=UPI0012D42465|nr:von Hippel-Lindau tumor suppressor homolog [Contarinia nasturtii]